MKPLIAVSIADEELEGLAQGGEVNGPKLARLLDDELARFQAWMIRNLNGGLTSIEKVAVKTYLYQKIVGRVDNLDSVPLDVPKMATKAG